VPIPASVVIKAVIHISFDGYMMYKRSQMPLAANKLLCGKDELNTIKVLTHMLHTTNFIITDRFL
jgi:hypothetical protein